MSKEIKLDNVRIQSIIHEAQEALNRAKNHPGWQKKIANCNKLSKELEAEQIEPYKTILELKL